MFDPSFEIITVHVTCGYQEYEWSFIEGTFKYIITMKVLYNQ